MVSLRMLVMFCVFLFWLMDPSFQQLIENEGCGTTESSAEGNINGTDLPSNQTCIWSFALPADKHIYMSVCMRGMQPGDHLIIYNGTQDQHVIANFSYRQDPVVVVTFSKESTVVYKVGPAAVQKGHQHFDIQYSTTECSIEYKGGTGMVRSPLYARTDAQTIDCNYTILNPNNNNKRLALSFNSFSLHKGNISIWANQGYKPPLLAQYTDGATDASDVIAPHGVLSMHVYISANTDQNYFTSAFTLLNPKCSGLLVLDGDDSVDLVSPGFPYTIPADVNCRWIVTSLPGSTMEVVFNDLDLGSSYNQLHLVDGDSKSGQRIGSFSDKSLIDSLILTSSNKLWIEFGSDESAYGTGFHMTIFQRWYRRRLYGSGELSVSSRNSSWTTQEDKLYYELLAPEGHQIMLIGKNASLWPSTSIDFYDGLVEGHNQIAHYRTDSLFTPVFSNGNNMLVVAKGFVENATFTNQQFQADFESVSSGSYLTLAPPAGGIFYTSAAQHNATWNIVNFNENSTQVSLHLTHVVLPVGGMLHVHSPPSGPTPIANITSTSHALPPIYAPSLSVRYLSPKVDNTTNATKSNIFIQGTYQTISVCDLVFNSSTPSGSFASPGYPNQYPFNARCQWNMMGTNKTIIRIAFNDFILFGEDSLKVSMVENIMDNGTVIDRNSTSLVTLSGEKRPNDVLVKATELQVIFSSLNNYKVDDLNTGKGFKATFEYLECGGSMTDGRQKLETPGYPAGPTSNVTCVWIIQLKPPTSNTSTPIISYQLNVKHYKHDNATINTLEIHDGGNQLGPPVLFNLAKDSGKKLQSRTNLLWIRYTYQVPQQHNALNGFALQVDYTTYECPSTQWCDNGVCMHAAWQCNGHDDCGDGSDEKNCTCSPQSKHGVSSLALALGVICAFIVGLVIACVAPIIYKRIKYPNYGELRDFMTPVAT